MVKTISIVTLLLSTFVVEFTYLLPKKEGAD